ncbi:hypothetical protein M0R45_022186 [Rubus argutus]|uniref:Uncharacterized protein n=1 Tax=Rubus argutus TaxID=59490 RepID=A0AAW1VM54_RUBAR
MVFCYDWSGPPQNGHHPIIFFLLCESSPPYFVFIGDWYGRSGLVRLCNGQLAAAAVSDVVTVKERDLAWWCGLQVCIGSGFVDRDVGVVGMV